MGFGSLRGLGYDLSRGGMRGFIDGTPSGEVRWKAPLREFGLEGQGRGEIHGRYGEVAFRRSVGVEDAVERPSRYGLFLGGDQREVVRAEITV